MNVDGILSAFAARKVGCLLIGGMNFLLRHRPELTYDVDLWINDQPDNVSRCEQALADLDAQWGVSEADWGPVKDKGANWLQRRRQLQNVFCLTSPHGAIDIFLRVAGLSDWESSMAASYLGKTAGGAVYRGLSDCDMLACQLALQPSEQKLDRIATLRRALTTSDLTE